AHERSVLVHQDTATRLDGLAPWTNYSVRVAAATEAGAGVNSQYIICTTREDVPLAVGVVKAFATGPHSVIVSWAAPPSTRGHLKHYTVYWHASSSLASQANYKKVEP
ncbi:Fibronectin type III, partial [Trinorchestia longiramus]